MSHYQPYTYNPRPQPVAVPQNPVAPPPPAESSLPAVAPDTELQDVEPLALPLALASEEPMADPPEAPPEDLPTEPRPVYSPQTDVPVPPAYLPFPEAAPSRSEPSGSSYPGQFIYPPGAVAGPNGSPQNFATIVHPNGTIVLVLGIVGIIFPPVAIVAWIMSSGAKKEIATGRYTPTTGVSIGRLLGIIGTIILIVLLVVAIVLTIVASTRGETLLDWFR